MLKRIGLLILTNIAVVVMLNIVLAVVGMVFGINFGGMAGSSLDMGGVVRFCGDRGLLGGRDFAPDE